jgi:flagellar basal-body rod protein FlgC
MSIAECPQHWRRELELKNVMAISASALRAQSLRMRVIAENLANSDSVGTKPGDEPYRRKVVSFKPDDIPGTGQGVKIGGVERDQSEFRRVLRPGAPTADSKGYVAISNVNTSLEMVDMQSAQRSYEANLSAIEASKNLTMRTLDLLK